MYSNETNNKEHRAMANVIMLSEPRFMLTCTVIAVALLMAGRVVTLPLALLAAEVFATILGLFLFGSFRYQIHKNALTYGMSVVIVSTFCSLEDSQWHREIAESEWWFWVRRNLLSFHGLNDLIHADTMLF